MFRTYGRVSICGICSALGGVVHDIETVFLNCLEISITFVEGTTTASYQLNDIWCPDSIASAPFADDWKSIESIRPGPSDKIRRSSDGYIKSTAGCGECVVVVSDLDPGRVGEV